MPYHYIIQSLFTEASSTQSTWCCYQEKIVSHINRQKTQIKQKEQALEPVTTKILELSDKTSLKKIMC